MGPDIVHGDCIWVEIVVWERLLGHDRPVVSVPAVYNFLNIRKMIVQGQQGSDTISNRWDAPRFPYGPSGDDGPFEI